MIFIRGTQFKQSLRLLGAEGAKEGANIFWPKTRLTKLTAKTADFFC